MSPIIDNPTKKSKILEVANTLIINAYYLSIVYIIISLFWFYFIFRLWKYFDSILIYLMFGLITTIIPSLIAIFTVVIITSAYKDVRIELPSLIGIIGAIFFLLPIFTLYAPSAYVFLNTIGLAIAFTYYPSYYFFKKVISQNQLLLILMILPIGIFYSLRLYIAYFSIHARSFSFSSIIGYWIACGYLIIGITNILLIKLYFKPKINNLIQIENKETM